MQIHNKRDIPNLDDLLYHFGSTWSPLSFLVLFSLLAASIFFQQKVSLKWSLVFFCLIFSPCAAHLGVMRHTTFTLTVHFPCCKNTNVAGEHKTRQLYIDQCTMHTKITSWATSMWHLSHWTRITAKTDVVIVFLSCWSFVCIIACNNLYAIHSRICEPTMLGSHVTCALSLEKRNW